jgi:hypothetical protein
MTKPRARPFLLIIQSRQLNNQLGPRSLVKIAVTGVITPDRINRSNLYPAEALGDWTRFSGAIIDGPLVDIGILNATAFANLKELDWRLLWRMFSLST